MNHCRSVKIKPKTAIGNDDSNSCQPVITVAEAAIGRRL